MKNMQKIDYSVYLVTDAGFLHGRDFAECIEAALQGGVTLLQYRDKDADSHTMFERALLLKKLCAAYKVPLLINDRLDIAQAVQADGVHLGQSDLPVTVARKILGKQAVIGASAHNAAEAKQAIADGADYLGCGAVFGTTTKNDAGYLGLAGLQAIRQAVTVPIVGIGGVNCGNFEQVLQTGAQGAAIISGILAADDIATEVGKFTAIAAKYKEI
ncbi:thiamine phosphate synthase [Acidaminococcaceae bacterium]|uniref:thiamine phosphate synthase n=2 Tax=Phascolarctobacterium TaxID=33024 RepID=UPI0015B159F4